jgi:transcription-repair coupling factor (superfamily II helicase)
MASADSAPALLIANLATRLLNASGFREAVEALKNGQSVTIDGAWGSSAALAVSALTEVAPSSVVVVLPRERELDEFVADITSFGIATPGLSQPSAESGERRSPAVFPAWPSLPRELNIADPILGNRLRIVRGFESQSPPRVVVSTMTALLQPVPSRSERRVASRRLKVGEDLDLDDIAAWLVGRGFERVTALEVPGEFCVHGGIVDIFPPDSSDPVRIELFGDEIESIRLFDVQSQRKIALVDEFEITVLTPSEVRTDTEGERLPADHALSPLIASGEHVLDLLPENAWIVLVEMEEVIREGKQYLERLAESRGLFSVESTMQRCAARPYVHLAPLVAGRYSTTFHLRTESIERFGGAKGEALKELERVVQQDESVLIACHNEAARLRLTELLAEIYNDPSLIAVPERQQTSSTKSKEQAPPPPPSGPPLRRFLRGKADAAAAPAPVPAAEKAITQPAPVASTGPDPEPAPAPVALRIEHPFQKRVHLCVGHVARGFRLVAEKIVVLSDNELFARTELQRAPRKKRIESRAIDSFLDLAVNDLVVHLSHGIARFRGMELQKKDNVLDECLVLEFADRVKMYVPISLIHLVQKYVGGAKASPELSKIGGTSWTNKKKRVAEAVGDMAADMLKLQAERDHKPGLACPPRQPLDGRVRGGIPLYGNRRPAAGDCRIERRYAASATDGSFDLRRRRIWQDRSGNEGRVQGRGRRSAGCGSGSHHGLV